MDNRQCFLVVRFINPITQQSTLPPPDYQILLERMNVVFGGSAGQIGQPNQPFVFWMGWNQMIACASHTFGANMLGAIKGYFHETVNVTIMEV
jgi:hypothetical protein